VAAAARIVRVDTPQGPAEVEVRRPAGTARAALLLGHGAGGSTSAPDLQATAEEALALGIAVGLVTQPYRVAGKKATPRPPVLDEAWMAVVHRVAVLKRGPFHGLPLIFGGRSSGARVACRCAGAGGAIGVLALAFPLAPPPRKDGTVVSRLEELQAVDVPVLVVQGIRDRFGIPEAGGTVEVTVIDGDHGLKRDHARLRASVAAWLDHAVP